VAAGNDSLHKPAITCPSRNARASIATSDPIESNASVLMARGGFATAGDNDERE
jgi:hypothetical protein